MSWYRYPRTQGERRHAAQAEADARAGDGVLPRGRRRWKTPVTAWEDISRRTVRSWKAYRRSQYRPVATRDSTWDRHYWEGQLTPEEMDR